MSAPQFRILPPAVDDDYWGDVCPRCGIEASDYFRVSEFYPQLYYFGVCDKCHVGWQYQAPYVLTRALTLMRQHYGDNYVLLHLDSDNAS